MIMLIPVVVVALLVGGAMSFVTIAIDARRDRG
jgi:hypothetical protein